jgi:hypothetical protein
MVQGYPKDLDMTPSSDIVLEGLLKCDSCENGPCRMENNRKLIKKLGMPTDCPYGLPIYADFTATIIGTKKVKVVDK